MRAAAATLFLLALSLPAGAQECVPTTSEPDWTGCSGDHCWYVDNDPCQPDCIFSTWVYEESNGLDGLQRDDEVQDDTCGGRIEGDRVVF